MADSEKLIKEIFWYELKGQNYSVFPRLEMIDSFYKRRLFRANQKQTSNPRDSFIVVLYDYKYVVAWIAHRLIKPLITMQKKDFYSLINSAYKLAQRRKKQLDLWN